MRHEKIFKLEDGTKVKVEIYFTCEFTGHVHYRENVWKCGKGKRTWVNQNPDDDYAYRSLSMQDRERHRANIFRQIISDEQIQEVKLELWQKLKP